MKTKLIFLSMALSVFAYSKTFTYRIYDVPFQDITLCTEQASLFAKKITEQSGVPTFNSRCDWEEHSPKLYILVDYEAEKALNFVSTAPDGIKLIDPGFFVSLKDCQTALPKEESLFEKETGLKIIMSYCYPESSYPQSLYAFRIEAVGNPNNSPRYTRAFSDAKVVYPNAKTVFQKTKEYLAKKNATLVHVGLRTSMPNNSITLFYYSKMELELDHFTLFSFPSFEVCAKELDSMEAKLQQAGVPLPIVYCGAPFIPAMSADLLLYPETELLKIKNSLEVFKDYKTCSENATAVVEKYQAAMGSKVLTGICQRDLSAKQYKVSLFIKN